MIFDYIGRTLPGYVLLFSAKTLWIPVTLRTVFYALFIICIHPRLIENNYYAFAIMAVFALSNGYLGSMLNQLCCEIKHLNSPCYDVRSFRGSTTPKRNRGIDDGK
jgi:hypothetical protein